VTGEAENSFRKVATQWFEKWKVGKVERYVRDTETRLKEDVLSCIGSRSVGSFAQLCNLQPHTRPAFERF